MQKAKYLSLLVVLAIVLVLSTGLGWGQERQYRARMDGATVVTKDMSNVKQAPEHQNMRTQGPRMQSVATKDVSMPLRPTLTISKRINGRMLPTLSGSPLDFAGALTAGATYLRKMQADITEDNAGNGASDSDPDDAGWDWVRDADTDPYSHSSAASPTNLYGVTALGLYYAYLNTNDATYFTAMKDAADASVAAGTANIRTASDMQFLMLFNDLSGVVGTSYKDAAKAKYDWRIANQGSGTATGFAQWLRDQRGVVQNYPNGIIGWDLGPYSVVAQMLYARFGGTYDADADAIAEVLWQDSFNNNPGLFNVNTDNGWDPTWTNRNYWWYTLGVSGLIDAFNASGSHTSEIAGLVSRLQASQMPSGAISGSYGANPTDEDWQSTAYVVKTLATLNASAYKVEIGHATFWISSTQDASGGWLYSDNTHYPEIGGENTMALYYGVAPATVWIDDNYSSSSSGAHLWGYDAFAAIQDGIDAAGAGAVVNVYPGDYNEVAAGRTLYNSTGPYQFGLFLGATKGGITVQGVTTAGSAITNYASVVANVTTNATNSFGYSGIWVEADNATITGLKILPNTAGDNKTIEVIGNNFTIKYCDFSIPPEGGSLYFNDWRFSAGTSYVQSYWVEGNRFDNGTSIDIADGAGYSGAVSSRKILNNTFINPVGSYWPSISFSGSGSGVPWFVNSVGGAVIQGNSFTNNSTEVTGIYIARHIRARATYDNSQFDWASYWNDNSYNKGTIVGANPPNDVQTYSYVSGTYTFNTVRQIGVVIKTEVDNALDGDKVLVKAGTYNEGVMINKSISLIGTAGPATTIIDGNHVTNNFYLIQIVRSNVTVDGFTITNPIYNNSADASGIAVYQESPNPKPANVHIQNCIIHDIGIAARNPVSFGTFGINIGPVNGIEINNCTIYNIRNAAADVYSMGIFTWGNDGSTAASENINIHDNTIFDIDGSNPGSYDIGIAIGGNSKNATVSSNTVYNINNDGIATEAQGIRISGFVAGTVSVNGNNHVTTANFTGIRIGNAFGSVSGNTIDGTGQAMLFTGVTSGSDFDIGTTTFGSSLSEYIRLTGTTVNVNASTATFDGSPTNAQKEAKIYHRYDDVALGLVNFGQFGGPFAEVWVDDSWAGSLIGTPVDGHLFGADAFTTIPDGITAVTAGGKVNILAGTYAGPVTVGKAVQLLGAASSMINAGGPLVDALTISANGVTVRGLAFSNYQTGVKVLNKDYAVIQNNTLTGGSGTTGVFLSGAQQCVVSGNTIAGNDVNIKIVASTSPVRVSRNNNVRSNKLVNPGTWSVVSDPVLNKVNFNVFTTAGTTNKYVQNTSGTVTLDAQYNWFGGENPPGVSTLPDFSGNVNFAGYFATNPTLFISPTTQYVPIGSPVIVSVSAMLPEGVYAKGSSIVANWTNPGNFQIMDGPTESAFFGIANTMFFVDNLGAGSRQVDQTTIDNTLPNGGVGDPDVPYIEELFTFTLQPGAGGQSNVTLGSIQLRKPDNSTITILPADILPLGGAVLTADAVPPTVTNVYVENLTLETDVPAITANGTGDDYLKNTNHAQVTALIGDDNTLTTSDIVADLSPLGGSPAANPAYVYPGPTPLSALATWDVPSVTGTSDGLVTINVTATDVVFNSTPGSDAIIADNTPPTPPTAVKSFSTAISGHGKVNLTWTSGTDAPDGTYKGLVAQYNTWTYPSYAVDPGYPTSATTGTGTVSATPIAGTSTVHAVAPRGIYNYTAFSVDWAGNYSTEATAAQQDRAANYFLGDLGSGTGLYPGTGYDGNVNFNDLIWFSNAYFTSSGAWDNTNQYAQVNIAPTTTNKTYTTNGHRFGIPVPDLRVNFEDLMIFSMNYLNTTPKILGPQDRQLTRELAVELMNSRTATSQGEMLTVTVRLANDGSEVKGVSTELSFDPSQLQFVDANAGGVFGGSSQGFFYANAENGKVRIDAAVLGIDRSVDFSGNLAVVRFRAKQAGQGQVTVSEAIVRGLNNMEHPAVLNSNAIEMPTSFSLAQNYPNPFNPSTRIDYQVPATSRVTIAIYNVLGEKVATLVNEVKEAGYYNLIWNGRTDSNIQVASGMYIYSMQAEKFLSVKKMMILK